MTAGDIEEAVQEMWARSGSGHGFDLWARVELARDHVGDIVERGSHARHGVERSAAAVAKDPDGEVANILDRNMIALLLAVAEYGDRFAFGRLPSETVRPIAGMRVAGAVNEGRAQDGKWALVFGTKHQLTRRMHHSVHR